MRLPLLDRIKKNDRTSQVRRRQLEYTKAVVAVCVSLLTDLACAQGSVVLYGRLDVAVAYGSFANTKTIDGKSSVSELSDISYWRLRGAEDLGGGTKAIFKLESWFNVANGAVFNPEFFFLTRIVCRLVQRRLRVSMAHSLAVPALLRDSDMLAIVPSPLGQEFERHEELRIHPVPYDSPVSSVPAVWHARNDHNSAMSWLRRKILEIATEVQT
jgi:DNA-binding transcriptional LysR family regulator